MEKRHIKKVIEDDNNVHIVFGKSEDWEGIMMDGEKRDYHEEEKMGDHDEEKMHHEDRDAHYKALIKKILDMLEENGNNMDDEDRDEHYEEKLKEIEEALRIMHEEEKDAHEDEEEKGMHDEEEKDMHEEKSFRNNIVKTEKRYYNMETRVQKRGNKNIVVGHAAVYGKLSEDLGGFREMIRPGAFDSVLNNDVRVFFNHDPNYILGRTKAGTAKISSDKTGLKYEFEVPDTSAGRDLLVSLERGDISQSSFAFSVEKDSWADRDGRDIRTIEKVKRLYDVSPVSIPAYPDADDIAIAKRSLKNYKNENENKNIKRNLLDLKIKILKNK